MVVLPALGQAIAAVIAKAAIVVAMMVVLLVVVPLVVSLVPRMAVSVGVLHSLLVVSASVVVTSVVVPSFVAVAPAPRLWWWWAAAVVVVAVVVSVRHGAPLFFFASTSTIDPRVLLERPSGVSTSQKGKQQSGLFLAGDKAREDPKRERQRGRWNQWFDSSRRRSDSRLRGGDATW